MLVSFSGLDCAGKSTQINLLKETLIQNGGRVKEVWSRGGYTPGIEFLKNLVRRDKKKPEERTDVERQAMVNAQPKGGEILLLLSIWDLIFYWGVVFRLKSLGKKFLFCDRYFWDTYIDFELKYPKSGFESWISWKILKKVYRKPDLSFVMTITPEESMRRSSLKFEPFPESEEKRKDRLNEYLRIIAEGKWQFSIDCMRSIEEIQAEIVEIVNLQIKK